MDKENALYLLVANDYPADYYSFIKDELTDSALAVKTELRESGMMAGIEWALPTAIVAYLLKPFFEAFLQEAGKDAYSRTKDSVKKLVKKNLPVNMVAIAAKDSPNKLSQSYDQSRTISVKAAIHSNITFTVLFDNKIKQEDFDVMLEGLFTSLEMLYMDIQELSPDPEGKGISKNELYLVADMDKQTWLILSKEQMLERYRNL